MGKETLEMRVVPINHFVLTVLWVTYFLIGIVNWKNCFGMEMVPVLKSVF